MMKTSLNSISKPCVLNLLLNFSLKVPNYDFSSLLKLVYIHIKVKTYIFMLLSFG